LADVIARIREIAALGDRFGALSDRCLSLTGTGGVALAVLRAAGETQLHPP
jgi:hypothetical protein